MQTIYEPKGRAAEYSHLALNLMTGCPFGCTYCYCPAVLHVPRRVFHSQVHLRWNAQETVIEALEKAAPRFAGTDRRVLLNFIGDPYCPQAVQSGATKRAIEILRGHDIPFQTLTKAGAGAVKAHLSLYRPGVDLFAVTLTCDHVEASRRFEPGAADPGDRVDALNFARYKGIETWASMEPVLDPEMTLRMIRMAAPSVDLFKIGTLNHVKSDIDRREFGKRAIDLCERLGKRYYIKEDLAKDLDGIEYHNTDNRCVEGA